MSDTSFKVSRIDTITPLTRHSEPIESTDKTIDPDLLLMDLGMDTLRAVQERIQVGFTGMVREVGTDHPLRDDMRSLVVVPDLHHHMIPGRAPTTLVHEEGRLAGISTSLIV